MQVALLLTGTLFPVTYIAYVPVGLQAAALGGMSMLAKRIGYPAHIMPKAG